MAIDNKPKDSGQNSSIQPTESSQEGYNGMLQSNMFSRNEDGVPEYNSLFGQSKPSNPNEDFEHGFGNTPYPSTRTKDTTAPISRTISPIEAMKSGLQSQNDPNAYHEDPDDPALSAINYVAGPKERKSNPSDNAKKIGLVADALRHIGNIINTSDYAPAQNIQSTFDYLDKREKVKDAQRMKQEAMEADQAYKNYKMQIDAYNAQRKEQKDAMDRADKDRNYALKQDQWNTQKPYWEEQGNTAKARAEKAGYDAAIAKIRAGAFKTQNDLDTFLKRQKIRLNEENLAKLKLEMQKLQKQMNGTMPSSRGGGRGRSSSGGGRSSGGANLDYAGRPHKTAGDRNRVNEQYAEDNGISLYEDVGGGGVDPITGKRKAGKLRRKPWDQVAGETQKHYQQHHSGGKRHINGFGGSHTSSSRSTSSKKKTIKGFGGH